MKENMLDRTYKVYVNGDKTTKPYAEICHELGFLRGRMFCQGN